MFEMCMLLLVILKDCSKTESFGGSIALILKQIFQKILIFCTGIITIYKIWEEDKSPFLVFVGEMSLMILKMYQIFAFSLFKFNFFNVSLNGSAKNCCIAQKERH